MTNIKGDFCYINKIKQWKVKDKSSECGTGVSSVYRYVLKYTLGLANCTYTVNIVGKSDVQIWNILLNSSFKHIIKNLLNICTVCLYMTVLGTEAKLWKEFEEAWQKITNNTCAKFIESSPMRMDAVINNIGKITDSILVSILFPVSSGHAVSFCEVFFMFFIDL